MIAPLSTPHTGWLGLLDRVPTLRIRLAPIGWGARVAAK
jgi:hypothetical protein